MRLFCLLLTGSILTVSSCSHRAVRVDSMGKTDTRQENGVLIAGVLYPTVKTTGEIRQVAGDARFWPKGATRCVLHCYSTLVDCTTNITTPHKKENPAPCPHQVQYCSAKVC